VSKADIDALVTVAMRLTEIDALPVDLSSVVPRHITEANADSVGRELWVENWRLNWDLHPDVQESYDWGDESRWADFDPQTATPPAEIDEYTFMELFGSPLDATAARIISYYRYQTAGALWSEGSYGRQFTDALQALIRRRNGSEADSRRLPGGDIESTPWGLTDTDRDLFLRHA
jgi:hypothetical protein